MWLLLSLFICRSAVMFIMMSADVFTVDINKRLLIASSNYSTEHTVIELNYWLNQSNLSSVFSQENECFLPSWAPGLELQPQKEMKSVVLLSYPIVWLGNVSENSLLLTLSEWSSRVSLSHLRGFIGSASSSSRCVCCSGTIMWWGLGLPRKQACVVTWGFIPTLAHFLM